MPFDIDENGRAEHEAALAAYSADMRQPPHARSTESVKGLALQRGATVGWTAAEAFELVRETAPGPD